MKRLVAILAPLLFTATLLVATPAQAEVPGLDFTDTGCEGYSDSVARLYTAGLNRIPEKGGFEYWMVQYTRGDISLMGMADFFAASPEFANTYGSLNQDQFIKQIYRNILGREGEDEGVTYWNGLMSEGLTRGNLLVLFAESTENINRSGTVTPTLGVFNTGLSSSWSCGGWVPPTPGDAKNCGDFANRTEAQAWFDYYYPAYGDIAKLDGDNNLVPCESLSK